jgi:cell division transport system permease protein
MRADFVMSGVAEGIKRNLLMTIALILTTTISLFFLGGALLTGTEIDRFSKRYEDKLNVSLYLCTALAKAPCKHAVTPQERDALTKQFASDPRIASADYISQEMAYEKNKNIFGRGAEHLIKPDDFPPSFTIKLHDLKRDYAATAKTYGQLPGVSGVQNVNDSLNALLQIFDSARTGAFVFAFLILLCSIILMAITIQVAAQQRRDETSIMRLVGASRWMTQLPFIIEAVIAVTVGGLLACPALWRNRKCSTTSFEPPWRTTLFPG